MPVFLIDLVENPGSNNENDCNIDTMSSDSEFKIEPLEYDDFLNLGFLGY